MEHRLVCKKCWHVFDLSVPEGAKPVAAHCPACDSREIMVAPPWAPLGSGRNIFTEDEWSYECQDCKFKFRMPIPKSPEEDKKRICPQCNSGHLHLITGSQTLPLYCG